MGMQVKTSPNGLSGPQSPEIKPTRSFTENHGKKLDFSGASEVEKSSSSSTSPKPNGILRFLPLAHVLDLRSLALFRILFGLLQLSDIYGRLSAGKYDLAWYTSSPEERSYFYPNMPSQEFEGPLGQLFLFQRGSIGQEIAFFVVYGILLVMLTIGFQCQNCWLLPLIWLFTNGLISKGDAGSWGSDQLAQQLLIWMVFLPLSEEWSVDAWLRRKRGIPSRYENHQVKSIACLGLVLLINMMYLDCTLERTYQTYTWDELHESDWLWPDFPLVWYASNGSGTYNTWFTKIVRETHALNQFMTFSGFLIECLMPPLCLIFNQRYSHWFAINLMALHFGIGLIIAIPHFACMGILIHTIWIPTHMWDRLLGSGKSTNTEDVDEAAEYKKTDGDSNDDDKIRTPRKNKNRTRPKSESPTSVMDIPSSEESTESKCSTNVTTAPPKQTSRIRKVAVFSIRSTSFLLQCFFLYLLFCTFLAANGWFHEYTLLPNNLAFYYFLMSNDWGMWSPGAERVSPYTVILGGRKRQDGSDGYDVYNLFHFLKTGGEEIGFDGFTEEFLADTTYLYPSTRWEKALGDDWEDYLSNEDTDISDNILDAWCIFINEDLEKLGRPPMDAIEIRIHLRPIGTPERGKRYSDESEAQEGSIMRFCFEDNEPAEYYDDEDEYYDDEEEEFKIVGSPYYDNHHGRGEEF